MTLLSCYAPVNVREMGNPGASDEIHFYTPGFWYHLAEKYIRATLGILIKYISIPGFWHGHAEKYVWATLGNFIKYISTPQDSDMALLRNIYGQLWGFWLNTFLYHVREMLTLGNSDIEFSDNGIGPGESVGILTQLFFCENPQGLAIALPHLWVSNWLVHYRHCCFDDQPDCPTTVRIMPTTTPLW